MKLINFLVRSFLMPARINRDKIFSSILFIILLSFQSCKSPTDSGKDSGGSQSYPVNLSVVEVSCTEAWVKIENKTAALPIQINFTINNTLLTTINLSVQDTVIYLDSLLPNKTYTLEGKLTANNSQQTTNNLQITTLDTTSHNFTWQTFTFGDPSAGSSILYDAAVIDDNNIWAVGEIYMNDSTGKPDPNAYNAAHWDGKEWKLFKFQFYTFCGQSNTGSYPAKAVFALSDSSLIIGSASQVTYINGEKQIKTECVPITISINKIWGTSSNDFYVVGNSGSIAHYQKGIWQKIESGTTADFKDIFGLTAPNININKILAAASSTGNTMIFTISQNSANDTLNWPVNQRVIGLWLNGIKTYAAGLGIWINKKGIWAEQTGENIFYSKIKGSGSNNIFAVGANGVIHFNGSTWEIDNSIPAEINFTGLDVSKDKVIAVGFTSSGGVVGQAAIIMGTQIK